MRNLSKFKSIAYADVMLLDLSDGTLRWRMVEVKSSTGVKDYHHDDIAVQTYIAVTSGVNLTSVSLAHIDKSFTRKWARRDLRRL
jgi:hypothetical protein